MSTKRCATTELNDRNWDKEEEAEEKGVFQAATDDELKTRVIKKARRKLTGDTSSNNDGTKSIFSSFTGFTKNPSTATTVTSSSPFSFLSALSNSSSFTPKKENTVKQTEEPPTNTFQFEKSNTYYAKLKGLNQSVLKWIQKHVEENPLCILTPVFTDYEKYLKEIEKESEPNNDKQGPKFSFSTNGKGGSSTTELAQKTEKENTVFTSTGSNEFDKNALVTSAEATKSLTVATTSIVSFGSVSSSVSSPFGQKTNTTLANTSKSFKFGQPTTTQSSTSSTIPTFSFAQKTTTNPSGFSFTGAKPFTFGVTSNSEKPSIEATINEDEEENEPPKVEFTPVVEEDSIYSKKCKVFIKQKDEGKEANYSDRGVGTLHLKPVKGSDKTQLLVRADTNLGNIFLNFILNDTIPLKRMGKNNVMIVCIPTPESEQKPTPVLLRVKTPEEADELLETINKYKK